MAQAKSSASSSKERTDDETRDLAAGARDAASAVTAGIGSAADTVSARLPEAAAATRGAVDEATRRLSTGSDTGLAVGASFSIGLALGLLIAGAGRILVALALIPAAAMGMTLLDRGSITRRPGAA